MPDVRRLVENALLLLAVGLVIVVVDHGWENLAELSTWLGRSEHALADVAIGWLPIGGLLVLVGLTALRGARRRPMVVKVMWAVPGVPWAVLAATYLWTPLAGDREGWLDDLSAGGADFRGGVVAAHWALATTVALVVCLGVAQIASPRWQPGNATNERRSELASGAALAGPALLALALALLQAWTS